MGAWLEMGGEKKPLVMSELGCAGGCGREMGAENCADGCGRRGCNGLAGKGWGEEAAGDERASLHGQLWTANGWGELRGRLRTAWVPGSAWKWVGRRSRWRSASLAADGKWVRRIARTAADGLGAREWLRLEMGGEKKPVEISELGCADGCGREMGAENCTDGCGRRGCKGKGVAGNGWKKKPLVMSELVCADGCGREMGAMSELGCADGCGREMGAENCADGCGRRGCKGVAGNAWGEEAAGDERAWLRGRLGRQMGGGIARTVADGMGAREWLEMGARRRSRWRSASLAAGTAADGKWVWRIARTAADGVGAREWLEVVREKKPLGMSELALRGRLRMANGGENCADGCGRRGCEGVAGNGWGEEAAGDERAWLRGRLRTGNGCGELRGRLRTARVQGSGWKWVGRRTICSPLNPNAHTYVNGYAVTQNNFLQ